MAIFLYSIWLKKYYDQEFSIVVIIKYSLFISALKSIQTSLYYIDYNYLSIKS